MPPERLLVFVPMYNCEAQIARVLERFDARAKARIDTILVVDNRSTDDGVAVASRIVAQMTGVRAWVVRNDENYGLGGSHKVAFDWAITRKFDRVAVLHGDDQGAVSDLLPVLDRDTDVLLGARFHPDAVLEGYSRFRTFGNHVFNRLFSLAVGRRIHDLGSGLNLYRVCVLRDRFYQRFPDDLTFNYCMSLAHVHLGHDTAFFPITWREEDQVSNVLLFSQVRRVLGLLARFRVAPDAFLAAEHRTHPRASYPATVVANNETP